VNPRIVGSLFLLGTGPGDLPGGLAVLGGVEDQFTQEFSGGGVDDADLEVVDEDQDVGFGRGFGRCRGVAASR
jgi:hypothetical protein